VQERFVCDLDRVLPLGEQTRLGENVEHLDKARFILFRRLGKQLLARHPTTNVIYPVTDLDQPQEQGLGHILLVGVQPREHLVSTGRDRVLDTTCDAVSRHCQRGPCTLPPCRTQRMRKQRKPSRLITAGVADIPGTRDHSEVTQEYVDQTGFHPQLRPSGRIEDRLTQFVRRHGTDDDLSVLQHGL
jgi:hypothetical protein